MTHSNVHDEWFESLKSADNWVGMNHSTECHRLRSTSICLWVVSLQHISRKPLHFPNSTQPSNKQHESLQTDFFSNDNEWHSIIHSCKFIRRWVVYKCVTLLGDCLSCFTGDWNDRIITEMRRWLSWLSSLNCKTHWFHWYLDLPVTLTHSVYRLVSYFIQHCYLAWYCCWFIWTSVLYWVT